MIYDYWNVFATALITSMGGGVMYAVVRSYKWIRRKRHDSKERVQRAELGYQYGVENNTILREILKELRPNGNSSMRDAIDRLERHSIVTNHIVMALADRSDVGVFIANKDGEWVNCNNILAMMLGTNSDDLLGNRWRAHILPQDRQELIDAWSHAVVEHYDLKHSCRMLCLNGEVVEVEICMQLVPSNSDKVIAFVGIVTMTN